MTKKVLSLIIALLAWVGGAWADNTLSVGNLTIPKGGQAVLEITTDFDTEFVGFQLDMEMPDNGMVTPDMDAEGVPVAGLGWTGTDHSLTNSQLKDDAEQFLPKYRFVCMSFTKKAIPTGQGTLLSITLKASANAVAGQQYAAKLTGIEFGDKQTQQYKLADVPFTITIGAPAERVTLNEDATTAPETKDMADVTVLRTIEPGVWSTICLPFNMNSAQIVDAFGDDVELGEFKGWSFDGLASAADGITVEFEKMMSLAMEANMPYLIKVSSRVTEFNVNGVKLEPVEYPGKDVNFKVGRTTYNGHMYGYYTNGDMEPNNLFLNNNKFWLNGGKTTIKGYRASFAFDNVTLKLGDSLNARYIIRGGEATGMGDVKREEVMNSNWYTIGGQSLEVEPTRKGAYINNGRVIIK